VSIPDNTIYDIECEMRKAEEKFPNQTTEDLLLGTMEELGEVVQAYQNMKLSPEKGTTGEDLRKELLHLGVLYFRLVRSIGTYPGGYLTTPSTFYQEKLP